MKKSLDPSKKDYVIGEAIYFGQQITDFKEAILCLSEPDLIQLITDLKALKLALETNTTVSTTPDLEKFQEFYQDAEDYFNEDYDEDCPQNLRDMILKGIQDFCELLEKEDPATREKRIQDSIDINNKKIATRKANAEILARKQVVVEPRISGSDLELYESYSVFTKIKFDADLCLRAHRLIAEAGDLLEDLTNVDQEKLASIVAEYTDILANVLKLDTSNLGDLNASSLVQIKNKLARIFELFYYGKVSVNDFLSFDQETRLFFTEEPDALLSVAGAEEPKKLLAIKLAKQLHEVKNSGEADNKDASVTVYNKLKILTDMIIKHELPIELLEQWDDEFLSLLTGFLLVDPENSEGKNTIEQLSDIIINYNSDLSSEELDNGCSLSMAAVFKFSNKNILAILNSIRSIRNLIRQTTVTAKDLLNLDDSRLEYWLSKVGDFSVISRFKALLNYFLLPKDHLLSATEEGLKEFVAKPQIAIEIFDRNCKPFNGVNFSQCLDGIAKRANGHLDYLKLNGFLVNLSKLKNSSRAIIDDLQNLGLNFYQCRTIYDMIVLVNNNFSRAYVSDLALVTLESFRPQYVFALKAWFSADEIEIVCAVIDPYITRLEETLNHRVMHLPAKFAFIEDMVSDVDNINIAELTEVLGQRVGLNAITDGTISTEYLDLYRYLVNMLADKHPELDPENDNVLGKLKTKLEEYQKFPSNDMASHSNRDEEKLLEAIYDHDDEIISSLFADGKPPIGYNCKDTSYLASAALEASVQMEYVGIYDTVKQRIQDLTEFKLNLFLFANRIPNKSRAHQLAFAISIGDGYIVQAIAARCSGADLHAKLDGFGGKTVLELAANSSKPNRVAMINEVLAALTLEHKKATAALGMAISVQEKPATPKLTEKNVSLGV